MSNIPPIKATQSFLFTAALLLVVLGALWVQESRLVLTEDRSQSAAVASSESVNNEWKDFLVQNVCLDSGGGVIADDPGNPSARCISQRNLLPGEELPYRRSDGTFKSNLPNALSIFEKDANDGLRYHIWDSLDLGNGLFITTMNHERNVLLETTNSSFNPWGLNVIKADSSPINGQTWLSIIATRDASQKGDKASGVQYFLNPQCKSDQSWILYPKDLSNLKTEGSTISEVWRVGYMSDTTNLGTCEPGVTIFGPNYSQRITRSYSSGKNLDTIITYHQAYDAATGLKAYEHFYFTKEYGLTRWESWTNKPGAVPTTDLSSNRYGRCNGSDYAADLVRTDCRDVSAVKLIANNSDRPHPQSLFNLNQFSEYKTNLVSNADFMAPFVDGLKDNSFGKWSRVYSDENILDWAITTDVHKFKWLSFSCRDNCSFDDQGTNVPLGIYTDGDISDFAEGEEINIGATFRLSKDTPLSMPLTKDLSISISQYDSTGAIIPSSIVYDTAKLPFDLTSTVMTYFKKKVQKLPGAERVRFVIMPQTPKVSYQITMPYIAKGISR